MTVQPKLILILSGKRKSGKDYVANHLVSTLGETTCATVHLSAPLKLQYAKENNLDYEELMTSGSYKEIHRKSMIVWGEEMRHKDPSYFCCKAIADLTSPVWVVVDARRPSDISYFQETFKEKVMLVRIQASSTVRQQRGWKFTSGVDDHQSECALDYLDQPNQVDMLITNDGNSDLLGKQLALIVNKCTTNGSGY